MAKEIYRVEIPIEAKDNYSSTLRQAERHTTQFEKRMERTASRVNKRLNDLTNGRWSMTINAVDKASRVANRVSSYIHRVANRSYRFTLRAFDMASRTIGGVRRALTSIPALVTVTLGVIGAGKLKDATVGAAMSFEQYEVSMTHWLDGNQKKAKNLVKWMGQFADTTPFSSVDLFPALTRGIGVTGGDVKQAQGLLKLSADMAALTPGTSVSDAMESLADAQMGEMERLKAFNMTFTKKEFDKIGFAGVVDQLTQKFDGGAEKLSKTALGVLNTLKGYRSSLLRSLGEGILKPMKPRLDSINQWLADNQDKWSSWKGTVKKHGKQASEFVFSNLEKGFNYVQSRYLNNKEFMDLSFKGKVDFIMGDVNQWWNGKGKKALDGWWEGTGKPWASEIGLSIGESIFEGIKSGILKGLDTLGDIWGNAFEEPSMKSFGGAGAATLGAGAIGAMVLSPLLKVLKMPFDLTKWAKDKMPGGKSGKGGGTTVVTEGKKPSDGKQQDTKSSNKKPPGPVILDHNGKPISSQPSKPASTVKSEPKPSGPKPSSKPDKKPSSKTPPKQTTKFWDKLKPSNWKGLEKLGNIGKRIPVIGSLIAAMSLAGSSKDELPGAIGAAGGGITGAMIGGAVGSVVPVVGTTIGAFGGGILGSIFGEKAINGVMNHFAPNQASAAEQPGGAPAASGGSPAQIPDFTAMNQHAQTLTTALSDMASKAQSASHNVDALTMTFGEAAGWVAGAFYPLQGSTAGLSHNVDALTMVIGESSGWIAGAFYPLSTSGGNLSHNVDAMAITLAESTVTVANSFLPLSSSGAALNQNTGALSLVLGESSGIVVGAYFPLAASGPMLHQNTSALAMVLGMASGWVASINGVQAGAAVVKGALNSLAARINSVPAPSVSGSGASAPSVGKRRGGPQAYANGGFINRPHLGLVGEAGPEMIIPLSSGRRGRAMDLFNRTASMLGVRPYADGGLVGAEPIVPGYGESSPNLALAGTMGGTIKSGSPSSVHVSAPLKLEINNGGMGDESQIRGIVVRYMREFVDNLKEALNNRP
ncbi:hypothetical protein [Sporosarcina sp. FSL W7-1283]|uniref:hypothetical protein n=1 Tax=Sporosarcina sp. FSL W7-1283 TaxID=2921560 RepID=UPI0030FA811A